VQKKFLARVREAYIQRSGEELRWKETGSFLREPTALSHIFLKWAFSRGDYRVEVQIYRYANDVGVDATYNHRVFDRLIAQRAEVEAALNRPTLKWKRDIGDGCGVFILRRGGVTTQMLEDPERAKELIEWSTSEMKHLKDTLFPFLQPLL
jgi:hypothetical protein